MTVSVRLQFLEQMGNTVGYPLGSTQYQYGHRVAYLPDRLLGAGPVLISGLHLQMSGYVGTAGETGAVLIFLDKKKYASNTSLYPLTQNTDYMYQQLLGQMAIERTISNRFWASDFIPVDPPVEYVPGEDCIVTVVDANISTVDQLLVWMPHLTFDSTPAWMSGNIDDIPDADCLGGNDKHTRLFLRGDECANGSPSFQDRSWRNYTVRWFGSVRLQDGYYNFPGGNSVMSPELFAPGVGGNSDLSQMDWNLTGDFTWDVFVKPSTVSNAYGPILTFTKWWGHFILAQRNGGYYFYATTANSVWNVAENVLIGSAAAGTETMLSVERCGNALNVYQDGNKVLSYSPVIGPLFYPLLSTGMPRGRPIFGMQADVYSPGVLDGQSGNFVGGMRNIRFSKIARYGGSNFTPPTGYKP